MAKISVDWGVLMLNHPNYDDIGEKVKGIPAILGLENQAFSLCYRNA